MRIYLNNSIVFPSSSHDGQSFINCMSDGLFKIHM